MPFALKLSLFPLAPKSKNRQHFADFRTENILSIAYLTLAFGENPSSVSLTSSDSILSPGIGGVHLEVWGARSSAEGTRNDAPKAKIWGVAFEVDP